MMGKLYIVATPIGNLEDISPRALRVFSESDVLVCEDTRKTRKIFSHYDISRPSTVFSYHEHNEENAGKRILGLLEAEQTVTLCSDGGYPGISDPGYRIIRDAIAADHEIEVIPGPSSVPVALLLSGLPTSSYTFKGFPPRKSGPRKRFLEPELNLPHTLVILESPYRVVKFLTDALEVLGNRQAAVCIELTKKFERVHRGDLRDLIEELDGKSLKGEVTVVIAGNHPKFTKS